MAMKQEIDCWTSFSSTDGEGEGSLQSSHEHDEGNICIKEEGEVEKKTCLSIPGSDGLRYDGQLITHDGLVFAIKQEVDTDMFESLSSTEGQDPSTKQEIVYATIKQEDEEELYEPITTQGERGGETEQSIPEEIVYATIKQEDEEEIYEPITTQGEGGGETEQSIPEELDNGQDKIHSHITACSGEKSHLCIHCSKTFTDENAIILHQKIWCAGFSNKYNLTYRCSQCNKGFSRKSSLTNHLRIIHTTERPYPCSQCNKGFSRKYNLKNHLRIHTTEKPFKCSQCDKGFSHEITLISHLRMHSEERPHQCSYCDTGFFRKCHLTSHLRTHTGERPFKCTQCDKRFGRRHSLTRHLRTHSGEKPYN